MPLKTPFSVPKRKKLQIRLASYAGNVEYVQAGAGKMDGSTPIGILVSVMNELSSSLTAWQITSMLLFRIRLEQGNKKLGGVNSTLKTALNKWSPYYAVFASIIQIRIWIEISL